MPKDLGTTTQNWLQRSQASGQAFADGVQNTSADPTALAIRSQGALLSNFTQSVTSGRWARNLSAVGKAGWQSATIAKAANYGVGIAAGEQKYSTAMQTWLPRIHQAAASARAMPSGSIAASNARSAAFATALYNAKRS